jgi:N-dimethylarginine dimethylaminohydrolase
MTSNMNFFQYIKKYFPHFYSLEFMKINKSFKHLLFLNIVNEFIVIVK